MSLLTSSEDSKSCHSLRINASAFNSRIPQALWRAALQECQQRARDGYAARDDYGHSPEVHPLPCPPGVSHDV